MLPSSPLSFAHRHWHIAADAIHRFAACAAAFTGGRPSPPRSPAPQPRLPSLAAARPTRRSPAGEPGATLRPTPRAPERLRPHPPGSTRGAVLCADAGRDGVLRAMTAPTPSAPGAYMAGVVDGTRCGRSAGRSIVAPSGLLCLVAWDLDRENWRTFRLDRCGLALQRGPGSGHARSRRERRSVRGRSLPRRPPGQAAPQADAAGARGILG